MNPNLAYRILIILIFICSCKTRFNFENLHIQIADNLITISVDNSWSRTYYNEDEFSYPFYIRYTIDSTNKILYFDYFKKKIIAIDLRNGNEVASVSLPLEKEDTRIYSNIVYRKPYLVYKNIPELILYNQQLEEVFRFTDRIDSIQLSFIILEKRIHDKMDYHIGGDSIIIKYTHKVFQDDEPRIKQYVFKLNS